MLASGTAQPGALPNSFTPWSTLRRFAGTDITQWIPEEDRERIASYLKYDELYWNDDTQFELRVLEGEEPVYIPNSRTIVDTTAHFLLKGLQITVEDPKSHLQLQTALNDFLDRELFYSRFHQAKHAGVARGDYAFHMTADPRKAAGSRISLTELDPGLIFPVYDPDNPDRLIRLHIVDLWWDDAAKRNRIKKLTYEYQFEDDGTKRVYRTEGIFELEAKWWGNKPVLVKELIPYGPLDASIQTIPVYWFKNMGWSGQRYGSSDLRGFESLLQGISQAATDQEVSLGLQGLGVYATDGGRPVDDNGVETDWEIAPGKVMEVPSGAYFRRVEGLSSLKPSLDHINYLESKLRSAGGLSDVALGQVDVVTAQSGIALAIKFLPTLAKLEERDTEGVGKLKQLFFDWVLWHRVFEKQSLEGKILVVLGDKLPEDRTSRVNELNNMLDRKIISRAYYRQEMQRLGYEFPDTLETDIEDEARRDAELAAERAQMALAATGADPNAPDSAPPSQGGADNKPKDRPNQSNNRSRPNESGGTEATQTRRRQSQVAKQRAT